MEVAKYYHTLRYLKTKQIYYQIYYRLRKTFRKCSKFKYPLVLDCQSGSCQLIPFPCKYQSFLKNDQFNFLNLLSSFSDWNDSRLGMLWAYNLNYMDYLLQEDMSVEEGKRWIDKFVAEIESNRIGLNPYPIALRGVNWIKFVSIHQNEICDLDKKRWDASLYAQYQILFDNLEYHLMGNHLLEDAFSLYFASFYFQDTHMFDKSSLLLREQLQEQVLDDGGHYELSPMYHCILLDRLLDCINITRSCKRGEPWCRLESYLISVAQRMCGWLAAMQYQNGEIPLLNDAANGIAPTPGILFDYAQRLGLEWRKNDLTDSGYRKKNFGQAELIMDVGAIRPDYIPGHAHADTFNYELRWQGHPFIIDTGISTYNKNKRRQYERGTEAHNTVTINGRNSSEVWGGFRVARRACVLALEETSHSVMASCSVCGVKHERSFIWNDNGLMIKDRLSRKSSAANYIILHPDVKVEMVKQNSVKTNLGDIEFEGNSSLKVELVDISFEYNKLIQTHRIKINFSKAMSYRITWK